jgi:manganese efflux pump family protein
MKALPLSEILLISLGLSADAFSVALAAGAQGFTPRRIFRLAFHFGLFQFMMPLIGWYGGESAARYIGRYGFPIVCALLAIIGIRMIFEGFKKSGEELPDLSKGWKMVSLSIGTSIDALAVGFGLGLIGVGIITPAILIGVICAGITTVGLYLGVRLYEKIGQKAMIFGGLILVAIGIKMII